MKRKCNILIIIAFVFCCFMPVWAETFTYTYDEVGNMTLKDGDDDDDDGLSNTDELGYGTDPQNDDTDADGMPDGWEVANGLDPLYNDANGDPDNDGVSNYDEYIAGTNPNIPTDLVLAYETILTGEVKVYQAENSITAGPAYIVESGADVTFKAGNTITLKPGFSANDGSYFSATIE
jgi:hypothetical protein